MHQSAIVSYMYICSKNQKLSLKKENLKLFTVFVVCFKQDVNAINVVCSTKIHLPPHLLVIIMAPY